MVIMKMGRGHGAPPVSHGHMDYDTLEQSSGLLTKAIQRNDIKNSDLPSHGQPSY